MKQTALLLTLALMITQCTHGDIGHTLPCQYTPPTGNDKHIKGARYQSILEKYNKLGLPGISLLVRDKGGIYVASAGKADIEKNVDFRPCTVAKVASITKMFTGVMVHKLAEENQINLDDKVDEWLHPVILEKVRNCRGATIRQLMNHTTGIYDIISSTTFYLSLLNNPDKKWTGEELIKFAYSKAPKFELGKSCFYSNTNTLLLSMVISKVTGKNQVQLLHEKILNPLSMYDTYYYSHESLPSITAQGYFDLYNNHQLVNVTNFNTGSGHGYGGFFSTVFDLQKFIEALLKHKTVLTPMSYEDMINFIPEEDPEDPANDLSLGAGLMKRYFNQPLTSDKYGYGHTGRDLGYSANAFYFPNYDITCCFIVNYGTNAASDLRQKFYEFQDELTNALFE